MEYVVLLDENGVPIGQQLKSEVHTGNTPLHKGFSCYIFNDNGELLVTRRADSKKVWPGVWTNSLCGHPEPDEPDIDAIVRRADYELGTKLVDIQCVLPNYRYKTLPFNGIVENEFCPVYSAQISDEIRINREEVADTKWLSWEEYKKDIKENPEKYSYWAKDQLSLIDDVFRK